MNKKLTWGFSGRETTKENVVACVGNGWHGIVGQLIDDLFDLGWDGCVLQVKEKFGGLRFYICAGNQPIWDRIAKAEKESYKTCEVCEESGVLRTDGWMKTLCDAHGAGRPTEHPSI